MWHLIQQPLFYHTYQNCHKAIVNKSYENPNNFFTDFHTTYSLPLANMGFLSYNKTDEQPPLPRGFLQAYFSIGNSGNFAINNILVTQSRTVVTMNYLRHLVANFIILVMI